MFLVGFLTMDTSYHKSNCSNGGNLGVQVAAILYQDALNCPKKTAEAVIRKGADYLFSVRLSRQ
jgi:hypothetical protein